MKDFSYIIKTERLKICLASDDEMRSLIENETDQGLKAAYTEMLDLSIKYPENRKWYAVWFIKLNNGTRIGDLCFKGLSQDGKVEIGYGLLPEYFGNGYATEAVLAAVKWAASQEGVKVIEAETDADNKASQRVLYKVGFLPTGEIGQEGPRFYLPAEKLHNA